MYYILWGKLEFMEKIRINKNILQYTIGLSNDNIPVEIFRGTRNIGVIICPPDPHWNGNHNIDIINEIFWSLVDLDISVMRFTFTKYPIVNYNYDKYIAQTAVCVEEFIETVKLPSNFFIMGYSFGSLTALNVLLRRPELKAAVLIAPPVTYYNFLSWISSYQTNCAIIYGSLDEITPDFIYNEYVQFLEVNHIKCHVDVIPRANHYFHKKIDILKEKVIQYILSQSNEK